MKQAFENRVLEVVELGPAQVLGEIELLQTDQIDGDLRLSILDGKRECVILHDVDRRDLDFQILDQVAHELNGASLGSEVNRASLVFRRSFGVEVKVFNQELSHLKPAMPTSQVKAVNSLD